MQQNTVVFVLAVLGLLSSITPASAQKFDYRSIIENNFSTNCDVQRLVVSLGGKTDQALRALSPEWRVVDSDATDDALNSIWLKSHDGYYLRLRDEAGEIDYIKLFLPMDRLSSQDLAIFRKWLNAWLNLNFDHCSSVQDIYTNCSMECGESKSVMAVMAQSKKFGTMYIELSITKFTLKLPDGLLVD